MPTTPSAVWGCSDGLQDGTRDDYGELYTAIVKLQSDWHPDDLVKGAIKVV